MLSMCTSLCRRYISTLTLVRIRLEQKGFYTVHVANEDDSKEMTFDLVVKGEKVRQLSPVSIPCPWMTTQIWGYLDWRWSSVFSSPSDNRTFRSSPPGEEACRHLCGRGSPISQYPVVQLWKHAQVSTYSWPSQSSVLLIPWSQKCCTLSGHKILLLKEYSNFCHV